MYTVTWGALKQRAIKACQKRALKACTAAPGNAGPTAEQLNMLHAFVARALRGPHGDVVSDRAARFDPLGMRAFMARELAVQAIRAWAVEDAAKLVETYPEIVPAKSRAGHVTAVVSGTGDTARITIFAHAQ